MGTSTIRSTLSPYLAWIDSVFGDLAREAERNSVTAADVARDYLSDDRRRSRFQTVLQGVQHEVQRFWQLHGPQIDAQVLTLSGLNARFGGDLGPQSTDRLFERVGVYFDTLLIPDPLLRAVNLPDINKTKDYYVLKYGILQA